MLLHQYEFVLLSNPHITSLPFWHYNTYINPRPRPQTIEIKSNSAQNIGSMYLKYILLLLNDFGKCGLEQWIVNLF